MAATGGDLALPTDDLLDHCHAANASAASRMRRTSVVSSCPTCCGEAGRGGGGGHGHPARGHPRRTGRCVPEEPAGDVGPRHWWPRPPDGRGDVVLRDPSLGVSRGRDRTDAAWCGARVGRCAPNGRARTSSFGLWSGPLFYLGGNSAPRRGHHAGQGRAEGRSDRLARDGGTEIDDLGQGLRVPGAASPRPAGYAASHRGEPIAVGAAAPRERALVDRGRPLVPELAAPDDLAGRGAA